MRKVILNVAVSLDGFIEGPNGEFDWCLTDQDYGMHDFLQRTDAVFIGRKSFEVLMRSDPNAFSDKRKYVFSRSLADFGPDGEIIGNGFEERVVEMKSQAGKDIWLFGGALLTSSFLNKGFVDEMQLSIHPLILGKGKPLFSMIASRKSFELTNTVTYSTGLVQLSYRKV